MSGDMTSDQGAAATRCSWCSAELPSSDLATCPSCGATVAAEHEPQVPGVTSIDPEAVLRSVRATAAPRRSRLLSWISGETDDSAISTAPPGSLTPPPVEVRREILKLELEAHISNLSAEAGAITADEVVAAGRPAAPPGPTAPPAPEAPPQPADAPSSGAENRPRRGHRRQK